ncbi:hypothetical protein OCH239_05485 [Roseivivax halodurans JCM 10272]|uniref:Uncharacterized protein n=1 Tax=Roseivivax halodurans JCM 10272 TaxID=1449350 RepID=X7EDD0_9RHOB|nr:hypothetical protein [Roseivivax halodurans]ETX14094.1 hypothetical protein OCH239_05485 [Roseivivax halodurans JCM 10272]
MRQALKNRRHSFGIPALLALAMLASCGTFPRTTSEFRDALDRAPQVQRGPSDAWVSAPEIDMVLERALGPVTEQRILLPNVTSVSGDNFVLLRARDTGGASVGRFMPLDLVYANGGTPPPFPEFDDLLLRSRTDSVGVLSWATWTNDAGLTCVLAFRRLDNTSRIVTAGDATIDMMLRNCVRGDAETALVPALPESVGFGSTAAGTGAPRMLSPLAAPNP